MDAKVESEDESDDKAAQDEDLSKIKAAGLEQCKLVGRHPPVFEVGAA